MHSVSVEQEEKLISTIRDAGRILLESWPGRTDGELRRALGIQQKEDGTSVTDADLASNELLVSALRSYFPEDGIVSEETAHDPSEAAKARVWIIDPLDGTKSFIAGRDDFSVLVGLVTEGRPRFGLQYFPARNVLARAAEGHGASANGSPLRVSVASAVRSQSLYLVKCEAPNDPRVRLDPLDSGLAFFKVAAGELDGMILKVVTHQEWDFAAPMAVVLEAGGKVTDENGTPVLLNEGEIRYRYLVASNGKTHAELLALVERFQGKE